MDDLFQELGKKVYSSGNHGLDGDTVWLTQAQMVELFQSSKANISEHIMHVFDEGELVKNMVVRKFRTTTKHGAIPGKTQAHQVEHYNLDTRVRKYGLAKCHHN